MDLWNRDMIMCSLYISDDPEHIAENALVAMTLLIGESRPQEKHLRTRALAHLIHPEKP